MRVVKQSESNEYGHLSSRSSCTSIKSEPGSYEGSAPHSGEQSEEEDEEEEEEVEHGMRKSGSYEQHVRLSTSNWYTGEGGMALITDITALGKHFNGEAHCHTGPLNHVHYHISMVVLHMVSVASSMAVLFAAVLIIFRNFFSTRAGFVYATSACVIAVMPVGWALVFFRIHANFTKDNVHRPRLVALAGVGLLALLIGNAKQREALESDEGWLQNASGMYCLLRIVTIEVFGIVFFMYFLPWYHDTRSLLRRVCEGVVWGLMWVCLYIVIMVGLICFAQVRMYMVSSQSTSEKRMLVLLGFGYKFLVDLMISAVNHTIVANVHILRQAVYELDMTLTDTRAEVLPMDVEENVLVIATTISYPWAFCASLASKLLLTALPNWQQVLLMSCVMAVVEVTATYCKMKIQLWKMHGNDGDEDQTRDDHIHLALLVTKLLSEMSVEYLVMSLTVLAALVYRGSDIVTGFGSYPVDQAVRVWLAQVLPELVVDFVCLRLVIGWEVNILPIYWRVQASLAQNMLAGTFSLMWLCFSVLVALERG